MTIGTGRANVLRLLTQGLAIACVLVPWITVAQGLTGALVGTVTDAAGGVISGAVVRISSPALIGGELTTKTDERGQLRFPSVPPGSYALEIVLEGFRPYRDADIRIGAGATIERTPVLTVAALADSIVVHGSGSRLDARDPGFGTRFGAEDLDAIPMRRFSYQDWVKTAPGISPTSPAGSNVLVSALGSGVDQNQYLLDGTSITATGNGVSRADPGVDFIQELQIQSVGASVEYGNVQGAVVNVISKSGSNRFQYDAAYYWQTAALTSQPVRRVYDRARQLDSGYERAEYRDFTTSLGGPIVRDRLWFFSGYQHLRDSDSQPATNPDLPREYEQDKVFAKFTWRLARGWQLTQSFHDEFWSNPETPSATKPRDATQRLDASVPAINFGHLIHTASPNTVWDVRVGRFRFTQDTSPTSGDPTIPNRIDQPENIWSGGPQQIGQVRQVRTTVKATVSHYRAGVARRGSRMEDGRSTRSGRASRGRRPSDWRELCLQKRSVEAAHAAGARQLGRSVRHRRRVRERRRPGGRPGHDQSGTTVRSQPRHQSGRARVRRVRARDRTDHRRPGHGGLLEHRVAARGRCHQARYRRPNDAASKCREIRPGPADR